MLIAPRPPAGLGFNGHYLERHSVQILGSYRAYNPALMRFHNPDSLSPFGRGGLNAYAYCLSDPINHLDPDGHLPVWAWLKPKPKHLAAYSFAAASVVGVASAAVKGKTQEVLIGTSTVLLASTFVFLTLPLLKGWMAERYRAIRHLLTGRSPQLSPQGSTLRRTSLTSLGSRTSQVSVPRTVEDAPQAWARDLDLPPSYAEVTRDPSDSIPMGSLDSLPPGYDQAMSPGASFNYELQPHQPTAESRWIRRGGLRRSI